jgi:hypothetical protein
MPHCTHNMTLRLDSLGIAGFSYDFGTLQGKPSTIANVFKSLDELKLTPFNILIFLLSTVFPILTRVPSPLKSLIKKFSLATGEISKEILERTRKEKGSSFEGKKDCSIIGLLSASFGLFSLV